MDGAAHVKNILSFSSSMVPSTLRSGRAPTGSGSIICDVDGDGAVLDGGIDAGDLTLDDAVAGVDRSSQPDGDILRLGFGDFDFGLEVLGIGDAG